MEIKCWNDCPSEVIDGKESILMECTELCSLLVDDNVIKRLNTYPKKYKDRESGKESLTNLYLNAREDKGEISSRLLDYEKYYDVDKINYNKEDIEIFDLGIKSLDCNTNEIIAIIGLREDKIGIRKIRLGFSGSSFSSTGKAINPPEVGDDLIIKIAQKDLSGDDRKLEDVTSVRLTAHFDYKNRDERLTVEKKDCVFEE